MTIHRIDVRKLANDLQARNGVVDCVVGLGFTACTYKEDAPENRFAWGRELTAKIELPVRVVMPCGREYVYFCLGDIPLEDVKCTCGKENEWVVRWWIYKPGQSQAP